jgi:hypothetical protein
MKGVRRYENAIMVLVGEPEKIFVSSWEEPGHAMRYRIPYNEIHFVC